MQITIGGRFIYLMPVPYEMSDIVEWSEDYLSGNTGLLMRMDEPIYLRQLQQTNGRDENEYRGPSWGTK